MTSPQGPDHTEPAISRRALVKGAAWSVPFVTLAVAAPAAAASPPAPAATSVATTWPAIATSGMPSQFEITGQAEQSGSFVDAVLPAGTSVTITPPQGGVVTVSNIIEGSQVTNLDGSVTVVFSPDLIEASAQIVCTGFGTASLVGFVPGLTPPIFSMYQTVV